MKSCVTPARVGPEPDEVDLDIDLLKQVWQRDGEVSLGHFWQHCKSRGIGTTEEQRLALCALIKTDLRCRFERGQTVDVNRYLDRFPDLHRGTAESSASSMRNSASVKNVVIPRKLRLFVTAIQLGKSRSNRSCSITVFSARPQDCAL